MAAIIGLDIVPNFPAPGALAAPTENERIHQVIDNAILFEELGFDGYSVGERHHNPFLSSSPPVLLSHIAARTTRLRLFTGVTLLSVLDPVRVAEDYATLDHLSNGRLELIVGKGNGPEQSELFGISREQAWHSQHENYELLRALWSDQPVDWVPKPDVPSIRNTPLSNTVTYPRPYQKRITAWHGSSTSKETVELAAKHGDPIWVANRQKSVEGYQPLVDHYRKAWADAGRDPADAKVGAGFSVLLTETQEEAEEIFRPIYEQHLATQVDDFNDFDPDTQFHSFEDYIERSSFLIGTPEKAIQKLRRYHAAYGFSAISIDGHEGLYPRASWIRSLELLRDEVAPELERFAPADIPNTQH